MFPNQVTSRELCHNNPVKHFLGSRFEVTDSAFNSNQSGSQALSLSQLEFSQLPNSQELFLQAQHSNSGQGQDSPGRKFYQKYVSQGSLFNKQQSANSGRSTGNFVRDLDINELRRITKEKEKRDLLTTLVNSVKECYTKTSEVLWVLKDITHKQEQQSLNQNKEHLTEIKKSVSTVCEDVFSALRCKDKESAEPEELVKIVHEKLSEEKQARKTYFHDQQDILQQFLQDISNKALHRDTDTLLKTHLDEMKALLINYFNSSHFNNRPTLGRATTIGLGSERSLAGNIQVQVSDNTKSAMCRDEPKVIDYKTIENRNTKNSDCNRLEVNQDMIITSDYRTLTTDDERNKSSHINKLEADQDSIVSYKYRNIAGYNSRSTDCGYGGSKINGSRVIDSEYKEAINTNSIIGFYSRRPSTDWESITCPYYSRPPANMDKIIGHEYSPQVVYRTKADRNSIQVDNRNRTTDSDKSKAAGGERIIGSEIRQTDENRITDSNRTQTVYEDTIVDSGRRKTADGDRIIEFESRQATDEDKFIDCDRRYAEDWHCMRGSIRSLHTPRTLQDNSVQQTVSLNSPLSYQNSQKLWSNPSPMATVLPYSRAPSYNPTPSHSKDVNNLSKVITPKPVSSEKHPMNIQDDGIHTRTRRKLAQENDNNKHSVKQNRKRGRKTIGQVIKNMSNNKTFKSKRAVSVEKPQKLLSDVFGKEIYVSCKSKFTSPTSITEKATASPGNKYKIFRSRNDKTVLNRSAQHFDPLKASPNCRNNRRETLPNSIVTLHKTPNGTVKTPTMSNTSCIKDPLCQFEPHNDLSRNNESRISVNSEVMKQPSCDSSPCLSIKDIPVWFIKCEKCTLSENEANSSPEPVSDSSSVEKSDLDGYPVLFFFYSYSLIGKKERKDDITKKTI
ncbi:uncharacterized protein LOC143250540 isoform X7 [Tachypleus tridentatus]|uniref:uncharacterized protein LOC143250540 isoform X7 n=1 Tax=Tachypleus tridentatus TaxID=6853 RepID=UPI003FD2D294